MNSEDKKLLFQEYIMLLQLQVDYSKSQLLIKLFTGTLVSGGVALMFNHEQGFYRQFYAPFLGELSVDILSAGITIFILPAIGLFGLMNREFENFKTVNASLVAEIEGDYKFNNKPATIISPFNIQNRGKEINNYMKVKYPFLSKINILEAYFFWLAVAFSFLAFILNTAINSYL